MIGRERMSQMYEADQVQCPNCGTSNPSRRFIFLNPRTGRRTSASDPLGCLILLGIWLAISIVVLVTFGLLGIHPSGPLDGVVSVGTFIIGIVLTIPLYQALRRRGLAKITMRVEHFQCNRCGHEWNVRNEPSTQ
jgi:predicted RNA-binding Zn-ribbon protein involved in translation (DUF1610 family)